MFANTGEQLGGKAVKLPPKIETILEKSFRPPPEISPDRKFPPPPPGQHVNIERTTNPVGYWAIVRVPIFEKGATSPRKGTLIVYRKRPVF